MLRRLEERLSWPRSKTATDAAEPQPSSSSPSSGRRKPKGSEQQTQKVASAPSEVSTNADISTGSGYNKHISSNSSSSSGGGGGGGRRAISFSSHSSLSNLRESLPENPNIYDISEIRAATNKFLSKRHTSSSSLPSWRCNLRSKEVVIFQRKFHRPTTRHTVREKLSSVCKSHHNSIVKLLGVSVSGEYLYLVYEYVPGLSLAECLRNPNNPSFTVLSSWMSRIQIATNLAGGLDYIHNNTGLKNVRLVHNHIRSSSVIVVEHQREKENFSYSAKICHFGTAELCGEAVKEDIDLQSEIDEIKADDAEGEDLPPNKSTEKLVRSSSVKFQGTTGYMSPEFQYTGTGTLKSDVYAFGVVILELLSGDEPVRFKFDKRTGDCVKISIIDAAREVMEGKSGGGDRQGGLRKWLDKRLKDSFPMDVAEKLTRLALDCVNVEVDKRPDMSRVARKISKLYLESKNWADKIDLPSDFTVSIGPR